MPRRSRRASSLWTACRAGRVSPLLRRYRHLLLDLAQLLPHSKKDAKLDTKSDRGVLNEVADMKARGLCRNGGLPCRRGVCCRRGVLNVLQQGRTRSACELARRAASALPAGGPPQGRSVWREAAASPRRGRLMTRTRGARWQQQEGLRAGRGRAPGLQQRAVLRGAQEEGPVRVAGARARGPVCQVLRDQRCGRPPHRVVRRRRCQPARRRQRFLSSTARAVRPRWTVPACPLVRACL